MTKIGIVGCGIIAQQLLIASENGKLTVPIAGITNRTEENAIRFLRTLKKPPKFFSRKELINEADLIVEAASGSIVPNLAKESFELASAKIPISTSFIKRN